MRFSALILALLIPTSGVAQSYPEARSIVSIGGPVTEVIYALGQESRLVARDTTSVFPREANALPDVGYMRQLSAEGVLSVGPDLIITRDTAGPPEVLDQLRNAAVPIIEIHDGFSADSIVTAIQTIGSALDASLQADALVQAIQSDFDALEKARAETPVTARVLFILSNKGGRLNVAGRNTGASGLIALAGATNVMDDAFQGYKIMNDEAIISASPDIILMMSRAGDHTSDHDEVLSSPAIAHTPAGERKALIVIDPASLGFGPRVGQFAIKLHRDLLAENDSGE